MIGNHRVHPAYEHDRSPRRIGWLFLATGILGLIFLALSMKPAGGQEWHCPWTEPDWDGEGWVGEWDGEGQTSIVWSSSPYYTVEVCVRTAGGITYTAIPPATSGTITSDDPVVAYSLRKTSTPPTTVPETTTTEAPTTTTSIVSTTSTTEGTATSTSMPVTSSTTPGPVPSGAPPAPAPGPGELADTGWDWWETAAIGFVLVGVGAVLTKAKGRVA